VRFEDAFGNTVAGPAPVSFSSSNTNVVTVSTSGATGVLTGVAPGMANVLATADTLSAGIAVLVPTHIERPLGSGPSTLALLSDDEVITANGAALRRVNLVSGTFGPLIQAGLGPVEIVVDPAREFAYVLNSKNVSVLRLSNNSVVDSIAVPPGGGRPIHLIAAPDARKLYVGDDSGHVFQIDVATRTTATFTLDGSTPFVFRTVIGLAVSSDGGTLYASSRNGRVYRVRTADGQILGSSEIGGDPAHVVLSLDGTELYVVNQNYGSAWVGALDAQSLRLRKRVDAAGAFAIALHPNGQTLLVVGPTGMHLLAPATMTIRSSFSFGLVGPSGVSQVVFTSDGRAILPSGEGLEIFRLQ